MSEMSRQLAPGVHVSKPYTENAYHRGEPFTALLTFDTTPKINGIGIIAVLVPAGWLVVADHKDNDDRFTDIGPFPTPEAALVAIRLGKD